MNFENKNNAVKDAVKEFSVVFVAALLLALTRNIAFTPETTILLFSLAILLVLFIPLLIMGYPAIKTYSLERKTAIVAVVCFVLFIVQTGIVGDIRAVLLSPTIGIALVFCSLVAIWSLNETHEIETSKGTIAVRDYDLMEPYIVPGINIIILVAALILLNPNLKYNLWEATLTLYAVFIFVAIAVIAMLRPTLLNPLLKRGNQNSKINFA